MPNFDEFSRLHFIIFSSLCVFYVSQSELRHLQCTVCVCVCVCFCVRAYGPEWIALFPWVLPGELCYLQFALCMYVSQSDLCHLQWRFMLVCVCVRVCECIWSRVDCPISVSFPGWTVLFTARRVYFFLPPKENCATYSAQLVCVSDFALNRSNIPTLLGLEIVGGPL